MDEHPKPIYGFLQYPPLNYPSPDNYAMDITAIIAANLSAWMDESPTLNTIKRVSGRSGVGFGTVQRAKNGNGNTTIQNLAAIARAFGRTTEELIRPSDYATAGLIAEHTTQEPTPLPPLVAELVCIAEGISDRGQAELIGRAKEIVLAHPRHATKGGPPSCSDCREPHIPHGIMPG